MSRPIEPPPRPRQCLVQDNGGLAVCNLDERHALTSHIHVDVRDGKIFAEWRTVTLDDLDSWNKAASHPAGPRVYTIGEALEAAQRTYITGTPNREVTR